MTSIEPGWLGVPVVVIVVVATALAIIGIVYTLVPPARRFIRSERPIWWARDGLLAAFVAVLVLLGHSYVLGANATPEHRQNENQNQRISDLNFVRLKSSEQYQVRPFRGLDLREMNLAGLELRGADFVQANLAGANLTGTNISQQEGTPAAPDRPAVLGVRALLQGVNLCRADLTGADLRSSYLVNANLTGADLTFTRLQGAALNGSDLSAATMPSDASYLGNVYYDDKTIWPEGFQPPPSNTGNMLDFLKNPVNNQLYGDVQRPKCDS